MEGIDLHDLEDSFVLCRTLGHAWDDNPQPELESSFSNYLLALRCTRCTTDRYDFLNIHGVLIYRRYVYPEQYKTARITREVLRAEMVSRSLLVHSFKKRQRSA